MLFLMLIQGSQNQVFASSEDTKFISQILKHSSFPYAIHLSSLCPRTVPSPEILSLCSSSGGLGGGHADGILLGKLPSM